VGEDVAMGLVEAVRAGDVDAIAACYAPDAVLYHPMFPEPRRGRDAVVAEHAVFLSAFSAIEPAVRTLLRGNGTVALELVIDAIHTGELDLGGAGVLAPTGRLVTVPTVWVLVVEEGLIVEERDYLDPASLLGQLTGVLP
jgi:ketosteroid isomerase-like protein